MSAVRIFGFGSFFQDKYLSKDVDLLIVHENEQRASCQFAIECKKQLQQKVANAHITMLSRGEEKYFKFVNTARAILLGSIRESRVDEDIAALCSKYLLSG
jgi:hypothetical protein